MAAQCYTLGEASPLFTSFHSRIAVSPPRIQIIREVKSMPFDGIVTKCVAEDLHARLSGGRIEKIHQPERDEIHLLVRSRGENHRLLLSANPAHPRIHLTQSAKENPLNAPLFCMVLRKHLAGGKVLSIHAKDCDRVVFLEIESANELGDISTKSLIIEIMGKHSNIILVNENNKIINALIHVDSEMSRVREVMPARDYMPPPAQDKLIPLLSSGREVLERIRGVEAENGIADTASSPRIEKALLDNIMGFSPLLCREVCCRAALEEKTPVSLIDAAGFTRLKATLDSMFHQIQTAAYSPCILMSARSEVETVQQDGKFLDFHCLPITSVGYAAAAGSIHDAVNLFYNSRARFESLRQKKAGLHRLIQNNLNRCHKKYAIQQESLREAAGKDRCKLYGELITANIYRISVGAESVTLQNYYSETADYIEIPLDKNLSPQVCAQRYFREYRKAASTEKNAQAQIEETRKELQYLESVLHELEMSADAQEIAEIRSELSAGNYLSDSVQKNKSRVSGKKSGGKNSGGKNPGGKKGGTNNGKFPGKGKKAAGSDKPDKTSQPHRFISSDGLFIYVGKNNRQNDRLTLKTAQSNDLWFHVKNMPGSHVVIKKQQEEIPQRTILEAATLASYFSQSKMRAKVDVDYTTVRNVKKTSGAKPGMVLYENFQTLSVSPDQGLLERLNVFSQLDLQGGLLP